MVKMGDSIRLKRSSLFGFIQDKPWAISRSSLESVHKLLDKCGDSLVDISAAKEAFSLGREERKRKAYRIEEGSAVIQVTGIIDKRESFMTMFFGGTSTESLIASIKQALSDNDVKSIVLNIDSPGGTVDGTKEASDFIYNARGIKPIIAYVDGGAMSAAYWIASAADKIIAPETAEVGSIGVWQAHFDASKYYEAMGIDKTYIYAGEYKVAGHEASPLSEKDRTYMQEGVDKYYEIFINDIARNRGVNIKKVLNMAEGRVYIGTDALSIGLIDKIGGFVSALKQKSKKGTRKAIDSFYDASLNSNKQLGASIETPNINRDMLGLISKDNTLCTERDNILNLEDTKTITVTKEEEPMDLQKLKAEYPGLVDAIESAAITGFKSSNEYVSVTKENEDSKVRIKELTTKCNDLEKNLALNEAKLDASVAEIEMDRVLVTSSIPEKMYSKVKNQVKYSTFSVDGEAFVSGSSSFKAFSDAFINEVSDWEDGMSSATGSSSIGIGESKETGASPTNDLESYGRKVARSLGPIRSDEGK